MQSHNTPLSDVAIFWDYENCHASSQISGYEIVSGIRNVAHRFGPVKHFKAYMEVPDLDTFRSLSLRSELQSSGVSLTDCPHNGRKNVADQMIMVDMLAYAMDHPAPATLILISGDRDFAYAVSILRLRRYEVVVISLPLPGAHISLKSQASVYLDWTAVLGHPSSSSQPEDRAESPTTLRNAFSFQSPSARRASYLPTPETPHSRESKLPVKNDTAAVSGNNRSAGCFEDPFIIPKLCPEPKAVPTTMSIPPSVAECSYRPPGLRERVEAAAAPAYSANVPRSAENIVEAVTTPVQSTSTLPLPTQVLNYSNEAIATSQSTLAVQPLCSSPTVESGQRPAIPSPSRPCPSSLASIALGNVTEAIATAQAIEPCLPSLTSTACATVAGCSTSATISVERNAIENTYCALLLSENECSVPAQVPESPRAALPSGSPREHIENPDVQAVNPDPPATPIAQPGTAPTEEEQSLKHIPPTFQPLISVLLKYKAKGITQPLRSTVGYELVGLAKTVYQQGVANFSQLTALAEQEKLVQRGGSDGHAWISLHRDWSLPLVERTATVPPSSSSVQNKIPAVYQTLVDALEKCRAKGIVRPLRSVIALDIVAKDKKVYERAGVKMFRDFVALAVENKIVVIGGSQASAWISLHPDRCK